MSSLKDHILHNDHHIVVTNKPSAVGVSPVQNADRGFMHLIQSYVKHPLFTVHRVDVPVSGIVLFAKTKKAAAHLGAQFKEKTVEKSYLAVTRRPPTSTIGQWEDLIVKHKHGNKSSKVESHDLAKIARCKFEWIESLEHVHLIKLQPSTGRHHQLRVQMAQHIAPIRGDQKYGDKRGNRDRSIDLHALSIRFKHPSTNKWVEFTAPLPNKPPWKYFRIFANQEDNDK